MSDVIATLPLQHLLPTPTAEKTREMAAFARRQIVERIALAVGFSLLIAAFVYFRGRPDLYAYTFVPLGVAGGGLGIAATYHQTKVRPSLLHPAAHLTLDRWIWQNTGRHLIHSHRAVRAITDATPGALIRLSTLETVPEVVVSVEDQHVALIADIASP